MARLPKFEVAVVKLFTKTALLKRPLYVDSYQEGGWVEISLNLSAQIFSTLKTIA